MEVFRVDDRTTVPLSPDDGEYRAERVGARPDLRPLEIEQAEGPSFELAGHELRWQKWRLRLGFTPREGLVLHDVRYDDGAGAAGAVPGVVYRAGRAVRPSEPRALPPVRPRSRRAAVRRPRQLPRARVRLPRRDPLPRRGRQRQPRRAGRASQRDLHPRGGSGDPLEARGCPRGPHRGSAPPPARRLVGGDRPATTSTGSSGTSTRTARSSPR